MKKTPKPSNPIADYWKWFQENEAKYRNIKNEIPSKQLNLLERAQKRLEKFSEPLFVEIYGYGEDGEHEMVITAEGDIYYFKDVIDIVNAAPEIPGWKITAFRQPKGNKCIVWKGGRAYTPSDMIFLPLTTYERPNIFAIYVCPINYYYDMHTFFHTLVRRLVDEMLGEQIATRDIDLITVGPPIDPLPEYPYKGLDQLQEYIEEFKARNAK